MWSERSSVTIAFTSTTTAFTATSDVVNTAESAKLADAASANKSVLICLKLDLRTLLVFYYSHYF